jgi:hypothetical protein
MPAPVVLDLDGSVGPLPGGVVLNLQAWQQLIRFACSMNTYREFARRLRGLLPATRGPVFLGSGDFHHLCFELIAHRPVERPLTVVVLDNHPDNMRFPFGIHCGSWVRRVAALPFVTHVHVVGITSTDVEVRHSWENYLTPLLRGKLTNWCVGVDVGWAKGVGLAERFLAFDTVAALLDRFADTQRHDLTPVYLTIDKDVLRADIARTNWDQGCMSVVEMIEAVSLFRGRLLDCDVTGDISTCTYDSRLKRLLSAMDRQPQIEVKESAGWQLQQHEINLRLLYALQACGAER